MDKAQRYVSSLRTPEMYRKYCEGMEKNNEGTKFFATAPAIKEFKYWKIIANDYPYDKIAEVHHMLVPYRNFKHDSQMTSVERNELQSVKSLLNQSYDCIVENLIKNRSFPGHFHLHLIKYKV